jgi:hypothetical protein
LGVEAALLPDDAGKKLDREIILCRVLFDGAADVVGSGGSIRSGDRWLRQLIW